MRLRQFLACILGCQFAKPWRPTSILKFLCRTWLESECYGTQVGGSIVEKCKLAWRRRFHETFPPVIGRLDSRGTDGDQHIRALLEKAMAAT